MMYTFKVKMRGDVKLRAEIGDLKGNSWRIIPQEFTTVNFPYKDNEFTVTVFDLITNEIKDGYVFSIKSISDVFWMILSMTASGLFEFEFNEPLQILRKVLQR